MSTDCLDLLAMPPAAALTQVVQDALVSGVSATDLTLGKPTAAQGLSMSLPVLVPPSTASKLDWNYFGASMLAYTRLDLDDTFTRYNIAFKLPLPTTSRAVADKLQEAFGVVFDNADFVAEAVTVGNGQPYTFRAADTSTRWQGQVTLMLFKAAEES